MAWIDHNCTPANVLTCPPCGNGRIPRERGETGRPGNGRGEDVEGFLDARALKDLWGIGEKTLAELAELNITAVAQLRGFAEKELSRMLGAGAAAFLSAIARGRDPGISSEEPKSRSLSSETTFETNKEMRPKSPAAQPSQETFTRSPRWTSTRRACGT